MKGSDPPDVRSFRRFYQGYIGAEVCEQTAAILARDAFAQIQHPEGGERSGTHDRVGPLLTGFSPGRFLIVVIVGPRM
jgi:hypothetical protein